MLLILILLIGHNALINARIIWTDIGQVVILVSLTLSTAIVKAMMSVELVTLGSSSLRK